MNKYSKQNLKKTIMHFSQILKYFKKFNTGIVSSMFLIFIFVLFFKIEADTIFPESIITVNDTFSILSEFKDSPDMIKLKLEQVDRINKERKKHNASPVQLDILASRVANMHCYYGAVNGYMGHYDKDGNLPFMRYSSFGGNDHVSENAASLIEYSVTKGKLQNDLDLSGFEIKDKAECMEIFLKGFMKEGPGGGHYENVIDKAHNYVGIGFFDTSYAKKDSLIHTVRYAEEFLNRYASFNVIDRKINPGDTVDISGIFKSDTLGISAIIIDYFSFPKKMNRKQINKYNSYNDYSKREHLVVFPWDLEEYLNENGFSINAKFKKKKGLYYVKIFADKKKNIPYKMENGQKKISYSLKNAFPISGVIIRME